MLGFVMLTEGRLAQARCTHIDPPLAPFSAVHSGDAPPQPWKALRIAPFKRATQYSIVYEDGRTVLHARADAAASALMHRVQADTGMRLRLRWQWKVEQAPPSADARSAAREDAPARLIVEFTRSPQLAREGSSASARAMLGDVPDNHVLLMYIWSERVPLGTILPGPRSDHVRMIVVDGPQSYGRWRTLERDPVADLRAAFGVRLPWLTGIGVLTDSDNTGEAAEASYGDITLDRCEERPRLGQS
jgi:hypothetical protein